MLWCVSAERRRCRDTGEKKGGERQLENRGCGESESKEMLSNSNNGQIQSVKGVFLPHIQK